MRDGTDEGSPMFASSMRETFGLVESCVFCLLVKLALLVCCNSNSGEALVYDEVVVGDSAGR